MNRIFALISLSLVASCTPCPIVKSGCGTDGNGTLVITSTGLPPFVTGSIHLTGPTSHTLTSGRAMSGRAGVWSVTADRATAADRFVRSVYLPTVTPSSFCLGAGSTQEIIVTWAPVATSGALWASNANAMGQLLGFRSAALAGTATVRADVVSRGSLGADIAFDRDGNVWAPGGTTADSALQRFRASAFAASGMVQPELKIDLNGAACLPLVAGLAFDATGNLYLSSPCRNAVLRIDAADLIADGRVTPAMTIPVDDPNGIAIDKAGNLWVVARTDRRVWRYDQSQLNSGSASAPAFKLGGLASSTPMSSDLLAPSWVAFDGRGDLWANDFGGNIFYRLGAASLRGTGTSDVQPQVRITLGVLALLEGFAFDEEGGLWSAGAAGKLIRLAPTQLDVSSGPGAPTLPATVLSSTDIGSAANLALYPAPSGLPLFHSLP